MALTATVMGVFFSVFATQSQLYEAKDNELFAVYADSAAYAALVAYADALHTDILF